MKYVIDELTKSLRYHRRQMDENVNKIRHSEESIAMLKESNVKHSQAIEEIENHLDELEKAAERQLDQPIENNPNNSIKEELA